VRRTLFLVFVAVAAAAGQTMSCPESITVAKTEHRFERVNIYNGKQGAEEYDLAPDDEKTVGRTIVQTWLLKDYRSMNLFMRCRYHDTEVTRSMDLPAPLQTCTFTFEMRKDGTIVGKSVVVCR